MNFVFNDDDDKNDGGVGDRWQIFVNKFNDEILSLSTHFVGEKRKKASSNRMKKQTGDQQSQKRANSVWYSAEYIIALIQYVLNV